MFGVLCERISRVWFDSKQSLMGRSLEGLGEPLATLSGSLTSHWEAANTQRRIKQMNGHNPKGAEIEARGPEINWPPAETPYCRE